MIEITLKIQNAGDLDQAPNAKPQSVIEKHHKEMPRTRMFTAKGMPMGFKIQRTISLETKLRECLSRESGMNGAKVLSYLMDYANIPIHVSFLDWCVKNNQWSEPTTAAVYGFESQAMIPMTDRRSLRECQDWIRHQKQRIQVAAIAGATQREKELRGELAMAERYCKEVKTQLGKIKNFPSYWASQYHNVYTCTSKTIKKISRYEPKTAAYAKDHLVTGQRFMWQSSSTPFCDVSITFELVETEYDLAE